MSEKLQKHKITFEKLGFRTGEIGNTTRGDHRSFYTEGKEVKLVCESREGKIKIVVSHRCLHRVLKNDRSYILSCFLLMVFPFITI